MYNMRYIKSMCYFNLNESRQDTSEMEDIKDIFREGSEEWNLLYISLEELGDRVGGSNVGEAGIKYCLMPGEYNISLFNGRVYININPNFSENRSLGFKKFSESFVKSMIGFMGRLKGIGYHCSGGWDSTYTCYRISVI